MVRRFNRSASSGIMSGFVKKSFMPACKHSVRTDSMACAYGSGGVGGEAVRVGWGLGICVGPVVGQAGAPGRAGEPAHRKRNDGDFLPHCALNLGLPDEPRRLEAVHHGHLAVHQNNVEAMRAVADRVESGGDGVDSEPAILSNGHLVTALLEQR
eukprot:scaffold216962_cov26-Tisochrysis_lutea.AAC.3